jgi:methyl coenzyme M reductase subunit D
VKLLNIGKTKLKFEKKDGTEKVFKATKEAISDAKEIGKGKNVIAKWSSDYSKITGLSEYKSKNRSFSKGGNLNQEMTEMSVYKTVGTIIAGLEGVTVENVKEIVSELYEQGLSLVKGKKTTSDETKSDEFDEFSDEGGSEEEFSDDEEE